MNPNAKNSAEIREHGEAPRHLRATSLPSGTGFFANRLLVATLLAAVLTGFLAVADWMIKSGFSSQIDIGIAFGAALATGIAFQANYRRVVRLVDRAFLPKRYAAAVALDRIRESLRERRALFGERVADDLAHALGLTSVAVFARTDDGGFVRQAAFGWPGGTAWHLLPGEKLTASLGSGAQVVPLLDNVDAEVLLPEADARPCIAVTLSRRGRVQSAILLGPDREGRTPDADVVRGLAAVLGEMRIA
jgi:hypothetical protein